MRHDSLAHNGLYIVPSRMGLSWTAALRHSSTLLDGRYSSLPAGSVAALGFLHPALLVDSSYSTLGAPITLLRFMLDPLLRYRFTGGGCDFHSLWLQCVTRPLSTAHASHTFPFHSSDFISIFTWEIWAAVDGSF